MNKRFIVALLILGGVILLGVVLYWTLSPLFQKSVDTIPVEPLPPGQTQPTTPGAQPAIPAPQPAPAAGSPEDRERQAQEALKRQALDFSARQGTYSNADGFASLRNVYTEVTKELQNFFEKERTSLIAAHPVANGSWSQTTRAVASNIVSATPLLGRTDAQVEVQVQRIVNEQDRPQTITYLELTITFVKQGDAWLASRVEARPFSP